MNVKRYDLEGFGGLHMEQRPEGGFVSFDDYEQLQTQYNEALDVLRELASVGWVAEAAKDGGMQGVIRKINGLKRQARAVLSSGSKSE